ncbi:MAG TPA: hypothetical protein VFT91_07825 [Dehalococcoidia bacterium]|nr:hypothetical protein [Dehalococcoidia bacterium]
MKPRLLLLGTALVAVAAFVLVFAGADITRAGTFNPTLKVAIDNPEPEANSDFTTDFDVAEGDVNFAAVISFIPQYWGITAAKDAPIGAVVGKLASKATLGLLNQACNTALPVEFTMLNSSVDIKDTVSFLDEDKNNTQDFAEDKNGDTLKDAIDKYPDFINRVLVDPDGNPLQPRRRAAGIAVVAGSVNVLLQFLVFDPGTVINADLPHDVSLGYPSVTLLQNIGDPDAVPAPGPITDFCTPLKSTNTTYAISKDNPDTDADESGKVLLINPKDAPYTFTTISLGQRDADGDGYENGLDTCPFDVNKGDPRIAGDGDGDGDGLDAACDPNDNDVNSDEDLDGYLNRGDNCPLVANGENEDNQKDSDTDQIGDACDTKGKGPNEADGDYARSDPSTEVKIGQGTGQPAFPTGFKLSGGGGGGGSSTTLIIIIVVVVAAVVVIGGGAVAMRRRRGGG